MSMLLNLAVDLLFHVSINDMQLGCGDQSISQAGRQAVELHFHVPTNHMQLVSGDQSAAQSVRQRGRHAAGQAVKFSARQSSKQSTGQPVVQYFTHAGMFELNGQTVNVSAIHSVSQSISFSVNNRTSSAYSDVSDQVFSGCLVRRLSDKSPSDRKLVPTNRCRT